MHMRKEGVVDVFVNRQGKSVSAPVGCLFFPSLCKNVAGPLEVPLAGRLVPSHGEGERWLPSARERERGTKFEVASWEISRCGGICVFIVFAKLRSPCKCAFEF